MKERGMLFSAPMVRSILDGSKTQTRRALNARSLALLEAAAKVGECYALGSMEAIHENDMACYVQFCPYGQPGDRLWVRETHNRHGGMLTYRADGDWIADYHRDQPDQPRIQWKPSLFMRREDSRILLEITEVRVELLQDISEDDAYAEGVETDVFDQTVGCRDYSKPDGFFIEWPGCTPDRAARESYRTLWDQINGDGSWAANPWVWAVSFKRV